MAPSIPSIGGRLKSGGLREYNNATNGYPHSAVCSNGYWHQHYRDVCAGEWRRRSVDISRNHKYCYLRRSHSRSRHHHHHHRRRRRHRSRSSRRYRYAQHRRRSRSSTGGYRQRRRKRSRSRHHRRSLDGGRSGTPIQRDSDGHLLCSSGDIIMDRYLVVGKLGEGTFGRVFEVVDVKQRNGDKSTDRKQPNMALKVIRNKRHYQESARVEIGIINQLNEWDRDGSHFFIRLLDDFDYHGHACLLFPKYGMSVFDFMKANNFAPYPMEQVRHIAYQLCHAVRFMHDHGMVHTDLKPENMIFITEEYDVKPNPSGKRKEYRVMRDTAIRLIDFGATVFDRRDQTAIVSTRHYRAPEVILELGWSFPCDVWSIGCIIYELIKGVPMFQVHEDVEHLAMMQRVLGTLPQHMAIKSRKRNMFEYGRLRWDEHSSRGRYVRETLKPLNRCFKISDPVEEELFSLIGEMLQYPPSARMYLGKALRHRFFRRLPICHRYEVEENS